MTHRPVRNEHQKEDRVKDSRSIAKQTKARGKTVQDANTSGNPPRDAAKAVRTTIHRVSVGVLRIEFWHMVFCFVWVPSKTLKCFHGSVSRICYVQTKDQAKALARLRPTGRLGVRQWGNEGRARTPE